MAARITRSIKVKDITKLTSEQINKLKVGDVVIKDENGNQHGYIVSYKEEKHGICLTYTDASVVETQSYDYTEGHWVYNSADITPLVTNEENNEENEVEENNEVETPNE